MTKRAIIVGAGVGGLSAAVDLAAAGWKVNVFEADVEPGGKMHQRQVGDVAIDGGPTVFTMYWVFDELFKRAGAVFDDRVRLTESHRLARHAWTDGSHLDLFHDVDLSAQAIADFSDERNALGYRAFCEDGELVHNLLRDNFMATSRPSPIRLGYRLLRDGGLRSLVVAPHRSLWSALGNYFSDPRLKQLYGRYATYVGSSPLSTPSTLMLIAHVERQGVWCVEGGMRALAHAIADLATEQGAQFHFQSPVQKINCANGRATGITLASGETMFADAIIFNGDTAALSDGLLGDDVVNSTSGRKRRERGLSAITWCINANTTGFKLDHHNVFFATDYEREFTTIFKSSSVCNEPTVYVCAQDRVNGKLSTEGKERLLLLINAPADGDHATWTRSKLDQQLTNALSVLARGGLKVAFCEEDCVTTCPDNWHQRFPGSGGSLYGAASHGMFSSFTRPSAASRVKGLYLAGGSAHPGPGVPMASLSGSIAARRIRRDAA